MLAANLLVVYERRDRVVVGGGWRPGSVPPQAQVQGLFSKQCLDQRQVQTWHGPAVQHQDLVARTQTWEHRRMYCEKKRVCDTVISDFRFVCRSQVSGYLRWMPVHQEVLRWQKSYYFSGCLCALLLQNLVQGKETKMATKANECKTNREG